MAFAPVLRRGFWTWYGCASGLLGVSLRSWWFLDRD